MAKPVLVLVMSKMCGACQNFKAKMLPELEKELKKDPRFRFIILDFPNMAIPLDKSGKEFHPNLRNFIEFFPTFLLFPGNLWDDPSSNLKGVAKHELKKNPNIDYSKSSLNSWIEDTLKRDPLFNDDSSTFKTKNDMIPTVGTHNLFRSMKAKTSDF